MNILLLGANGQVGWELQRALAPLGVLTPLGRNGRDGLCGDLENLDGLAATVRSLKPDIIVNAAAYTAVDKAESEQDRARRLNAEAPAVLALEARAIGALLVHYSTDYVFAGDGNAFWREEDATAPLNFYGATKRDGEIAIANSGCRHLILRTSWVYAARGANFAKTMLRLDGERDRLNVVDDQTGAPTGADLLADCTAHAIRQLAADSAGEGLYHLAAGGTTTWHAYANFVFDTARALGAHLKLGADAVHPVPSSAFPTPARRPANSRLATEKFQKRFGLTLPPWQTGVERLVRELQEAA